MSYTDTMQLLANQAAERCLEILEQYQQDRIDYVTAINLLTAQLVIASDRAASLADVALAAQLTLQRGVIVNPIGITTDMDATAAAYEPMVIEAVDGNLGEAAAAIVVLGRALTLETAQTTYQWGMAEHGVKYWTREPNAGACEVCIDLANGIVPIEQKPWFHKGCGCATRPVE